MVIHAAAAGDLSHDPPRGDPSSPPARAGWALFDTRVATGHLAGTSTAAAAKTRNGRDVRVSLRRVATPPACSCVQLSTDDKLSKDPSVVAADGDLLLLHMVVAVKGIFTKKFPHNFFVYKADLESPTLLSLPPPPSDWKAQPGATGIARKGSEFVVANLRTRADVVVEVEVAVVWLYRPSSGTDQWETKQLAMPYAPREGIVEVFWHTDTLFSSRGFICWVDFHRGIIYCDVFSPDLELGFVRFPGIEMWRGDRGSPNMNRAVSICRGHLKFVDIDDGRFRSSGSDDDVDFISDSDDEGCFCRDDNYDGCTIRTWTLRLPEFEWEEEAVLRLTDLSSLPSYQDSPLPRAVPILPIVDMEEDSILHFIVNGPGFYDKAWMVTVDMKNKSLVQYALYENPIETKDCSNYDLSNVFLEIPFVSTLLFR
ncbi:unnamed protein product [Urochloa decumbens]|uniref:DUF1618 domain-containing protein n=1 Tax=Urochloa decumbens TaxID=240449 RepID=A0ABC8YKJ3_9POAL